VVFTWQEKFKNRQKADGPSTVPLWQQSMTLVTITPLGMGATSVEKISSVKEKRRKKKQIH
jgi:hypothetical protein